MTLMRERTASVTIPLTTKTDWVKINAGQEVPCRVLYSDESLARLSKAVESKELSSPADRVGLIMDAVALVKAGQQMSPESLVKLLASYKDESDYVVWQGIADALGTLEVVLSEDAAMSKALNTFARTLVLPLLEKVGWDSKPDDAHLTSLLRGTMVSLLSTFCYDDPMVSAEAKRRCEAFLEDPTNVTVLPSDIKTSVFNIYLHNGDEREYENVKGYYYKAKDNAERKTVLNSLGSIGSETLKLATLDWTTSGEIKLQDFFYAIGSVGRSGLQGRTITYQYFEKHHKRIHEMLGSSSPSLMDAVIVLSMGSFCSKSMADTITSFFETHKELYTKNERKVQQMVESIRINGALLEALKASALSKPEFWDSL